MYLRLLIVILCLVSISGFYANIENISHSCGPYDACECERSQIDCSNTSLELKTVCEYIGNTTEHNLTSLNMRNNRLGSVHVADMKGCEELTKLDLSVNKIETIENETFSVILKLIDLNLQWNKLAWLYGTTDRQMGFSTSLKALKINGNANITLEQTSFYPVLDNLYQLETLHMDGVPNISLPASYRTLKKLETLIFSGNIGHCDITIVTNETFENVPYIKVLNLNACNIRDVHAGGFKLLRYLEVLDLSENMLLGFRMLRNISYSLQFTSIKMLNYSKVHTTFGLSTEIKLRDICFLRNTSLSELDFSRNRLARFEMNSIIVFPESIRILRIEDNKFTFGLYLLQMGCGSNLEEYYGSYQNHYHNPEVFDDEPQTNDVKQDTPDTEYCPYMNPEYLRNVSQDNKLCIFFEQGETVDISHIIPTFPKHLRKIVIAQSNVVYTVPKVLIVPMRNTIEHIDFSRNVFRELVGPLGPLPNIKHVDLSQCYCSDIHGQFFEFMKQTLETLLLQQNNLGRLLSDSETASRVFNNFTQLRTLNLSTNTISYLPPKIFSGFNNLHILDLSFNNIEYWSIDVDKLVNLLHLHLRNNFIQSLPIALLQRLQQNSERLNKSYSIDLRNNTINMNCNNKEFLQWIARYNNNMIHFQSYRFIDMEGNRISANEFMTTVLKLDQDCASYTVIIVLCSVGLSVYFAVLIGGIMYKNRWNIRYMLRTAKIRHFRYKRLNDLREINYQYDAFISYANENFNFIKHKLMPDLKNKGLKLCLHDQNFLPGNNIADNIMDAISNSRRTVVVLSEAFLKSEWCLYEFNMARMESIYTRADQGCLIVVILEEISSRSMSDEMLKWIRFNTYIEYTNDERGEQLFMEHLEEALM